jgi:hypothetical protein
MGAGNENPANLRYRKEFPRESGECALNFLLSGISMKRVSQLTALALLMGLAASTTFAAETMPTLTLSTLQQQHGVAIDTPQRVLQRLAATGQRPAGSRTAGAESLRQLAQRHER